LATAWRTEAWTIPVRDRRDLTFGLPPNVQRQGRAAAIGSAGGSVVRIAAAVRTAPEGRRKSAANDTIAHRDGDGMADDTGDWPE
jgi:hypothetical protein